MASRKKLGATTSGIEASPKKRKRLAEKRAAEEKAWAANAGPLKVYFRDPETGEIRKQPTADEPPSS